MNDWNMFSELPEAGEFTPPPQPEISLGKPERKKYYPKPPKKKPPKKVPKDPDKRLLFEAQESMESIKESDTEDVDPNKRVYKRNRVYYGDDEEKRKAAKREQTYKCQKEKIFYCQIALNRDYDSNLIEYIESKPNRSEYIRGLLLNDMLENNDE